MNKTEQYEEIPTVDLRPGMLVHFADLVDEVVKVTVENPPSVTVRVDVLRRGQRAHWYAGNKSVQLVEKQ